MGIWIVDGVLFAFLVYLLAGPDRLNLAGMFLVAVTCSALLAAIGVLIYLLIGGC